MGKLLFFDIDGTLITTADKDKYIIPESTYTAIRLLQKNGHLCFVNSGRSMSEIDKSILTLGMDGFVCGCGTYISYQEKELFHQTIPFSLGNSLLQDFETYHLEWLLEGKETLCYSSNPYMTHIGEFLEEHRQVQIAFDLIPPEKANNLAFDKFCICLRPDSQFEPFRDKYQSAFSFIDRGNGFFEVVPRPCSKASGIRFLMEHFHIPLEDTFAIGDSTNDLPMLRFAGNSIAMGNSSEQLFDVVDYVTDSVAENGIYHAMQHYGLI